MHDFKKLMEAYHAAKIPVIPLSDQRTPLIKEWSKYNDELPEECLYRPNQKGIGFLPGPESGVSWIDVDAIEPELLVKIEKIIPKSPVKRFGAKGYAIAVKYNPKIPSYKFHNVGVEIFSNTGYIVIPPSHHNKTGRAYVWIGYDFLDVDKDNLPEITEEMIQALDRLNGSIVSAKPSGRNNKLVSIASAMLQRGESFDKVVSEIYETDKKEHDPRWFMDPTDKWNAKTEDEAQRAAYIFVADLAKGHIKKGYMAPIAGVADEDEISFDKETGVDKFEFKLFPKPKGMLEDFVELVNEISYTDVPNMSTGSALAIFSVLLGNQYSFERTKSNMIMLLLGPSGTGKKFGISAAKKVLGEFKGMTASSDYQSSNAISTTLSDYCTRLDYNEEFSKTLKLVSTGNAWQAAIGQDLCRLWDATEEDFDLPVLKIKKGEEAGPSRIISPFVSILTATTITEFKENTNKQSFTSGLIPRFLIAMDLPSKTAKDSVDVEKIERLTRVCLGHAKRLIGSVPPKGVLGEIDPEEIPLNPAVRPLFSKLMREYHAFGQAEPNELLKPMRNRFRQHLKKISLIHAISCGRKRIEEEDLLFAHEFLEVSWNNYYRLISESGAENKTQSDKERVYSIVLENPGITQNELTRKTQFLAGSRQRENIILDLIEGGFIIRNGEKSKGSRKAAVTFFAVKRRDS
jgi:hypothetical protein